MGGPRQQQDGSRSCPYLSGAVQLRIPGGSCAPFLMLIAEAFAGGYDNGISHLGVVAVPREQVFDMCKDSRLHEYYVQKHWNAGERTFSYLVAYDATNKLYFDWAQRPLMSIKLWGIFQELMAMSHNTERIADVVETALGVLLLAERVGVLRATLDKMLSPIRTEALYRSLRISIHSHVGCQRSPATK